MFEYLIDIDDMDDEGALELVLVFREGEGSDLYLFFLPGFEPED